MTTEAGQRQWALTQQRRFMENRVRHRKWCVNCEKTPTIAWYEGRHQYLCGCGYDKAVLGTIPDASRLKIGELMATDIARRGVDSISVQDVRQFIAPKATDKEILFFLKFCQYEGVNPFKNEVYYLPFWNKKENRYDHAIVTGVTTYRKRASSHPRYLAHQTGVIVVDKAGAVQYREGEFMLPTDTLTGGWVDVWLKGAPKAMRETVMLDRYDKKENLWRSQPEVMIAKTAEVHGLRKYCPEVFDDLNSSDGYVVEEAEFEGAIPEQAYSETPLVVDVEAMPTDLKCPIHQGKVWFKTARGFAHKVEGEKGPRGGQVWCNMEEVRAEQSDEPANGDTPVAPTSTLGDESEETPMEDGILPSVAIETLGQLFQYGTSLSYGSKEEMLKAMGVTDQSQIADLADAASKLESYMNDKLHAAETNRDAFGSQQ